MNHKYDHESCRYTQPELFEVQDKMAKTMYGTLHGGYVTHVWTHENDENKDFPLISEGERSYWMRIAFVAMEVIKQETLVIVWESNERVSE
jgi:hypothetical protein